MGFNSGFKGLMYSASSKRVRDIVTIPCRFGVRTLAWPLKKTWEQVLFNSLKQINSKEVNRNICPLRTGYYSNWHSRHLTGSQTLVFSAHQLTRSWARFIHFTSSPSCLFCKRHCKQWYQEQIPLRPYDVIHYMYVQFRVLARSFITHKFCMNWC
jgi:hypothetical protein